MMTERDERRITILYGSQTGTAEEVAEGLARDASRKHFAVEISSLDEFDIVSSQSIIVSHVISFI